MNTKEHLEKIKTKCQELLATAENRVSKKLEHDVHFCAHSNRDAKFIASCAGPAEAGWRATIAAIEAYQFESTCDSYIDQEKAAEFMQQLIAAWPEEILR